MFPNSFVVKSVFNGSTCYLEDGSMVKLLGVRTPKRGQLRFLEAKSFLEELIEGKRVRLVEDDAFKELTNDFGIKKPLRFVYMYVGDTFVNAEVIRRGVGDFYHITGFFPKEEIFKAKLSYDEELEKARIEDDVRWQKELKERKAKKRKVKC